MTSEIRSMAVPAFTLIVTIGVANCHAADTNSSSVPTRGDALAIGDKIKLNVDAPIFRFDSALSGSPPSGVKGACAPAGTIIEITKAPTAKTSTTATPSSGGAQTPSVATTITGSSTTVETTSATGNVTTKVDNVAAAAIIRVGPPRLKKRTETCATEYSDSNSAYPNAVVKHQTYEFTPADLDSRSYHRFGWTYGGLVVPNKVMIVDRTFSTSSSLLPYIGYENWGTGVSGTFVLAAGIGTAPASSQTDSGTSTSTRATFSVATGEIWTFAGVFKLGLLVGVDTAGSHTGFKYQGKPWLGISLGAGT